VRITTRSVDTVMMAGLQSRLSDMVKYQKQLTTGKVINAPSDAPSGALAAMRFRGSIARTDQHQRNIDNGMGWLNTADQAVMDVVDIVQRARELTLQGMSGTNDAQGLSALAQEMTAIHDSAVQLANTRYLDSAIFSGTSGTGTAYSSAGVYQGNNGVVQRTVADGVQVTVNLDGDTVFGAAGASQLFTVLQSIATDLASNPSGLGADLGNLDTAMSRLQDALGTVGARTNRLQQMQGAAENRSLTLTSQLSDVEDADVTETISEMQLQEMAYQAGLAATAKVLQPSLVDFMR